jgi:hypothetical protein
MGDFRAQCGSQLTQITGEQCNSTAATQSNSPIVANGDDVGVFSQPRIGSLRGAGAIAPACNSKEGSLDADISLH